MTFCKDLITRVHFIEIERQLPMLAWKHNTEAVPGHAAQTLVSLLAPGAIGTDQWPRRIVEFGVDPAGVVAYVEAHEAVEFGHLHTVPLQVENLRTGGILDDEQEREGKEDSRAPVPTPG